MNRSGQRIIRWFGESVGSPSQSCLSRCRVSMATSARALQRFFSGEAERRRDWGVAARQHSRASPAGLAAPEASRHSTTPGRRPRRPCTPEQQAQAEERGQAGAIPAHVVLEALQLHAARQQPHARQLAALRDGCRLQAPPGVRTRSMGWGKATAGQRVRARCAAGQERQPAHHGALAETGTPRAYRANVNCCAIHTTPRAWPCRAIRVLQSGAEGNRGREAQQSGRPQGSSAEDGRQ